MSEPNNILAFDRVTIDVQTPYDVGLDGVSLVVRRGDLVLIRAERAHANSPLADVAQGLLVPPTGRVEFQGSDWTSMDPDRAGRARGSIGRVFEHRSWISNLDVDENVTLAQRHHTLRPEEEIAAEADALARAVGLAALPRARPWTVKRADLRLAEWVRALVGQPALIILEQPGSDAYENALPRLLEAVAAARARGAGVLWVAEDDAEWAAAAKAASVKLNFRGPRLVPAEGE